MSASTNTKQNKMNFLAIHSSIPLEPYRLCDSPPSLHPCFGVSTSSCPTCAGVCRGKLRWFSSPSLKSFVIVIVMFRCNAIIFMFVILSVALVPRPPVPVFYLRTCDTDRREFIWCIDVTSSSLWIRWRNIFTELTQFGGTQKCVLVFPLVLTDLLSHCQLMELD